MRRLRFAAALLLFTSCLAVAPLARAQEPAEEKSIAGQKKEAAEEPSIWWNVANVAILAAIIGYFLSKNAGPFFKARTEQIQSGMAAAAKAQQEADERVAAMEKRIAGLGTEIEKMRSAMRIEMASEGERIRLETERHIRKIQEQAEQEIDSMSKAARRELKSYSAALALKSAEEQLKGRVSKDVEDRLVNTFIQDLHDGKAAASLRSRSSNN